MLQDLRFALRSIGVQRVTMTLLLCFAALAACACLIPARRATRIDPLTALRAE